MLSAARVVSFALLVLALFGIAQASVASRREATNAERLARGLGPARPRRLYSGTRTNAARSAASPVPVTTHTGLLALYAAGRSPTSGDAPLAWVGGLQVARSVSSAFVYQYTDPTPATVPVELNTLNDPGYHLGAIPNGARSGGALGYGNAFYVKFALVYDHSAAGAAEGTFTTGKYVTGYAQTTIYHVDPTTGLVTVSWVNSDGTIPPRLYVLLYANALYLTGDLARFYLQTGGSASNVQQVDVYFVPQTETVTAT